MQTEYSAPEHYGYALWNDTERIPGVDLWGHTGGAYGLRSAMFWDKDRHFGLVFRHLKKIGSRIASKNPFRSIPSSV